MEKKFFNPDWDLIGKSIRSYGSKEIYKESREIWEKIEAMERVWRIEELKTLPIGSMVRYTLWNSSKLTRGEMFKKIKDRRKYMQVERKNGENWSIPYDFLEIPREEEKMTSQDEAGSMILYEAIV